MNDAQQDIMEWGLLNDSFPQAALICYQLWAKGGTFAREVPVDRFYRNDTERGPILLWWNGRPANKIDPELPPGSITFTFNHPDRNGICYSETKSYIWKVREWVPGPKREIFMTVGGLFAKPRILDSEEGFTRWVKGVEGPLIIGR